MSQLCAIVLLFVSPGRLYWGARDVVAAHAPPPHGITIPTTYVIIDPCMIVLLFVLGRVHWGAWDAIVTQIPRSPRGITTLITDVMMDRVLLHCCLF